MTYVMFSLICIFSVSHFVCLFFSETVMFTQVVWAIPTHCAVPLTGTVKVVSLACSSYLNYGWLVTSINLAIVQVDPFVLTY